MGIFDFLSPKTSTESNVPLVQAQRFSIQDTIAPAAIEIASKHINISGTYARVLYVVSYPRFLNDGWLEPILNLDKELDVSITINPVDTAHLLKDFQRKVAEVESQISEREAKGLVRDPQLEMAYQNLEDLRDRLTTAEEHIFEVGLYIAIYADSEAALQKAEQEIKNILETSMIYAKTALFQQEQGFKSIIPIMSDELEVHNKFNTEPLSSFFPFTSFDLSMDKGILYGINRHNSSLVLFDRFSLANYNSVTFATSGAGKSYAIKLEILRSMMMGAEVLVIDPEHEYEYLAEATGGRFIDISLSSPHHINPFDLPDPTEDESPKDILRTHIIELTGLFRIILGGLTPEEEAIIDQALHETYALKDIDGTSDFRELPPPLLSDFEMVLIGMVGSESLVQRLQKYTTGSWAGFMNEPTNVDIQQKFIVFSLREMEEDLKPAAMYIIMNHIWAQIRRRLQKRLMVIDEAWWMLKSEDTAKFLHSLAKRGRKYYLGIATITQDVDDFLRSPYGVPMITNSSMQLLLKQSPSAVDTLKEVFNLTDEEKYLLLESGVGEGIFFAGQKHVALKIIASYTEDQIITSNPEQILAMQQKK